MQSNLQFLSTFYSRRRRVEEKSTGVTVERDFRLVPVLALYNLRLFVYGSQLSSINCYLPTGAWLYCGWSRKRNDESMKICIALTSSNILSNGSGSISLYSYRFEQQSLTDNNTVGIVITRKPRTTPRYEFSINFTLNSLFSDFGLSQIGLMRLYD